MSWRARGPVASFAADVPTASLVGVRTNAPFRTCVLIATFRCDAPARRGAFGNGPRTVASG
jgi:hypothetical protein